MARWFRVYADLVDDPKVQMLAPELFKALINLWCLASKNDGKLPAIPAIAFGMRMSVQQTESVIELLADAGLLDEEEGQTTPHNWHERQFQSDISTERVQRYRKRRETVSGTAGETAPDTEADTDTEISSLRSDKAPKPVEILCEALDETRAKAIIEHRRALRKPLKAHSARLLTNQLLECGDANDAADVMMLRGWQSIDPEWYGRAKGRAPPERRRNGLADALDRAVEKAHRHDQGRDS